MNAFFNKIFRFFAWGCIIACIIAGIILLFGRMDAEQVRRFVIISSMTIIIFIVAHIK